MELMPTQVPSPCPGLLPLPSAHPISRGAGYLQRPNITRCGERSGTEESIDLYPSVFHGVFLTAGLP